MATECRWAEIKIKRKKRKTKIKTRPPLGCTIWAQKVMFGRNGLKKTGRFNLAMSHSRRSVRIRNRREEAKALLPLFAPVD
jgi:hypothetical protein